VASPPRAAARSGRRRLLSRFCPPPPDAIRAGAGTLTTHPRLARTQCYKHVAALLDKQAKKNKDFASKMNLLFIAHNIIKESKKSAGAKSKFGERAAQGWPAGQLALQQRRPHSRRSKQAHAAQALDGAALGCPQGRGSPPCCQTSLRSLPLRRTMTR
jgi:hypothetical protein